MVNNHASTQKKPSVLLLSDSFFLHAPRVFLATPLTQKPITLCVSEHSFFSLNEEKSMSQALQRILLIIARKWTLKAKKVVLVRVQHRVSQNEIKT